MSFLKAEWRKLSIINYEIDPKVLKGYIPFGTELDFWNDKCYISVVGFMFLNTKLLGVKIPFHTNFEEVNLRFYVKRFDRGAWKRGVVFIKEIVPKQALTLVANWVYNENYETMPMSHEWKDDGNNQMVEYKWQNNSNWQFLKVIAEKMPSKIAVGSETEFITEHYWGYAKINDQKTNEYEVTHPRWDKYSVIDYEINIDFALNYGDDFAFMNQLEPSSVMLAEGSEITVEPKQKMS